MMKPNCSSSMAERTGAGSVGEIATAVEKEVKYKGVRKRKWGKWVSEIRLPNSRERIWLGSYDTAEKAARAFDAALFCLRGRNAKFNFADNPPPDSIRGGGSGRSLTPAEIQVVASQYANSYLEELQPTTARVTRDKNLHSQVMEMEDTSPSSTSDGVAPMDAIDWSFLDMLEPHNASATRVTDYSLISGLGNLHEDMYMPPDFGAMVDENEDENNQEDGNGNGNYSHHSFLWNF